MAEFHYRNAEALRDVLGRHGVEYLFLGKSGAILLGYSDSTQDADLFVRKQASNCRNLVAALVELGFPLTDQEREEISRGKALIQLRYGPFDIDVIFAPDGIERFEDAWKRRTVVQGFPVCSIDDIIASKKAANRVKDRESLPRLISFRDWLKNQGRK